MVRTLDLIGGRWKPIILHLLRPAPRRFSELHRSMPAVSRSVLARQLRELEADRLVIRSVQGSAPPKVTYSLSALGASLGPALDALYAWGAGLQAPRPARARRIVRR